MKKLIALLLVFVTCLSICSCGKITEWQLEKNAVALAAQKQDTNYKDLQDEGYKTFLLKVQSFSAHLTAEMTEKYGKDDNFVISPISVYMGLALACECAVGETREEILDAVGVTYDEVNKYTSKLYAYANKEYSQRGITDKDNVVAYQSLNNSIWLDDSIDFVEDGVNKLANDYNCDVFQASVKSGEMEKLINKYIENKTNGLIDGDIKLSPETYFVLMNTYYLKEIWNEFGNNLPFVDETINFQNGDGSFTETKLLQGYYNHGKVYDGDRFTSFFTKTEHNFKIYFFLPDEEWSVASIFTADNINTILTLEDWGYIDDENRQLHNTRVFFPEFEADFDEDIANVLADEFVINKMFDPNVCDMSNISVDPVYCEGFIHKVDLTVDKKGIEGASVVYIPGAGAAGPPEYEEVFHDFVITGAFGFVITDSNGTVVFSGVINEID